MVKCVIVYRISSLFVRPIGPLVINQILWKFYSCKTKITPLARDYFFMPGYLTPYKAFYDKG